MTTIRLLVEYLKGLIQVTAYDAFGELATVRARNRRDAIEKAKARAEEAVPADQLTKLEFVVEDLR